MLKKDDFFNPFALAEFTNDYCFLCGCKLDDKNRSDEHVFPKWLQHEFKLWDQFIILANNTSIPYKLLTIPCCKNCNNVHLSSMENDIRKAYQSGYAEFKNLDDQRIFQWTFKIFYGLLFKELSLLSNRRNPSSGTIMKPEVLEQYRNLHCFLQSVRIPFEFINIKPWSIFVVETRACDDPTLNFNYHDNINGLAFSIRMGGIGIVASFEDASAQKFCLQSYYDNLEGIKLHPIQFDELAAKVAYKSFLLNRIPKYLTIFPDDQYSPFYVDTLNLQGFDATPVFNEWDQKIYAKILASYWASYGLTLPDIYREPNEVLSFIENRDGSIIVLNLDGTLNYNKKPIKL